MSKIQVNEIVNHFDNGAPDCPRGLTIAGVATAATLDVTGNVSVGGTLTYDDVTNIDSVGIITAQAGVNVTGGTVTVGADPNDGANAGTKMTTSGVIQAARASGSPTSAVFMGFLEADTSANFRVNANGSGYLMGNVGIGTDSVNRRCVVSQSNSSAYSSTDFDQNYQVIKLQNTTDNQTVGMQFLIGSNGEAAITATEISDGTTDLAFGTRGSGNRSEKVRITSGGNIGVNSTDPTSYANEQATIVIEDTISPALCISDTGQARDWFLIGQGDGLAVNYADGGGSGSASNVTTSMFFKNNGNIGIKNASPTESLHVVGSSGGGNPGAGSKFDIARFVSNDFSPTNSGGLTIGAYWNNSTANGRRAYIQSSQNLDAGSTARGLLLNPDGGSVGIGTDNATENLHVYDSGFAGVVIQSARSSGNIGGLILQDNSGNNKANVYGEVGGELVLGTDGDERVRITSAGDLGVNTTNPGGRIESSFDSSSTIGLVLRNSNQGTCARIIFGSTIVGSITNTNTATAYNTSSDYRLKENVVDISGAIDRVKQLSPKRFNFIADPTTIVDGFLAHEAQTVVPEAVTGTHNGVDDEGNAVMQGIDQSKLVPLLTAALQEAITKIETLEAEVTALKGS